LIGGGEIGGKEVTAKEIGGGDSGMGEGAELLCYAAAKVEQVGSSSSRRQLQQGHQSGVFWMFW
jgi:hypothetical protein